MLETNMKNQYFQSVTRVLLVFVSLLGASHITQAADALAVRFLFVADTDGDWAMHEAGAQLGVDEGNIQGQFLGIEYTLEAMSPDEAIAAIDSENLPAAVVVAGSRDLVMALHEVTSPRDVGLFNVALADDDLRHACLANLFHALPSDQMLSDAVAQWQQANPGTEVEAHAWNGNFMKFAGRDLNRRFREAFDATMDSAAWSGWAATRGLAEAVVRTMSNDPAVITEFVRSSLAFDGQKGVAQSYRVTGQLRQPLLITENGNLLGEAPVRGVAAATDLDSLGISSCQ